MILPDGCGPKRRRRQLDESRMLGLEQSRTYSMRFSKLALLPHDQNRGYLLEYTNHVKLLLTSPVRNIQAST